MAPTAKPTILLVHGAWHGSWCWKDQIPELAALGYSVETVDLPSVSGVPGKTQFDDADHVRACVEKIVAAGKQVAVLAHSYGGPIASAAISEMAPSRKAATDPQDGQGGLLGLIVLCGYIFPGGMDQGAAIRAVGGLPYVDWDTPSEGLFVSKDPASMLYVPDVSEHQIKWALPQLRPQSMAANMGIVPAQAWQKDAFKGFLGYIQTTADAIVPLDHQQKMIKDGGGEDVWTVCTLDGSGHSPQMSRPRDVAGAVEGISEKFQQRLQALA